MERWHTLCSIYQLLFFPHDNTAVFIQRKHVYYNKVPAFLNRNTISYKNASAVSVQH